MCILSKLWVTNKVIFFRTSFILWLGSLVVCVPPITGSEELLDYARQSIGAVYPTLGEQTPPMHIDPNWIEFSSSLALLPYHKLLLDAPFQAPMVISRLAGTLNQSPRLFANTLINLSIFLNQRAGRPAPVPWQATPPAWNDTLTLLTAWEHGHGGTVTDATQAAWQDAFAQTPEVLRRVMYQFLQTALAAQPWLDTAREGWARDESLADLQSRLLTAKPSPSDLLMLSKLPERTELRALLATSVLFADFCSEQADSTALYQEIIWEGHAVFPTTAGAIILAGTQDNTHHFEEAPLLLIDCGGNDQYSGTFSIASASQAVSLTIDARGEDEYTSQASPLGAGAACLGFSALLDLGSEGDRYQGEARCFGYAAAGVALLFDADGDSRYAITHHGLGTGEGGIAMLIDTGGEDHYEAVHHAQGCGILGGFGLLLDTQGADAYIAKATPALFTSAQRPDLNFSGCQGFGMGRFGAQSDGIALPGGIGCLIDGSGDDLYQAAIFAQGAGYGYGIGHLVDFGGNDRYTVTWYGQGSAAHQAVGILIDESGDDIYTAEQYMACGAATDLSLALFHDRAGADTYSALNASLGYSIDNSLALFLEEQGDDSYTLTNGLGFGSAKNERPATIRGLWPTWGVFFDAHGNDQYRGSAPSNGKDWSAANPAERGFGIGLDREENKTGDKQP